MTSQPLFDVHLQYLQTFLIDSQGEVSRFRCRTFHYFAYVSKFSSIIIVFIFYKLSVGDCLAFRAILQQPFLIKFLDIIKSVFPQSDPLRKMKLFA